MNTLIKTMRFLVLTGLFGVSLTQAHGSSRDTAAEFLRELAQVHNTIQVFEQQLNSANRLNWKVGEFHNNEVKLSLPFPGSGHKQVTQEVPARNAFWYVNEISVLGQKQKTEMLMDRATGKTLELIVNGKKEPVDDASELEIIEQYETEITVPAGTFDCMYIKAKVTARGQTQELEAWINPIQVNLDGMLKVVVQSQMGPVQLLLKNFGKK